MDIPNSLGWTYDISADYHGAFKQSPIFLSNKGLVPAVFLKSNSKSSFHMRPLCK